MTKEHEKARMLLGAWAEVPRRTKELLAERSWAAAQADAMPTKESEAAWRALVEQIDCELQDAARLRAAVAEALEEMGDPYAAVVRLRYEKGESYAAIARKVHYSVDRVRHIKADADRMIEARLGLGADV